MRILKIALVLALITAPAAAETIQATDAASHVGQTTTVEGVVSNVYVSHSGTTFIDMGGSYPNSTFTAVIFSSDASKFPNISALSGKKADITGPIKLYRGKPEIILNSADQVKPAP